MQSVEFISKMKEAGLYKILFFLTIVFNSFILALFSASGLVYLLFQYFDMFSFVNLYIAALVITILAAASAFTLLSLKLFDYNPWAAVGIHMVLFALFGSLLIGMTIHDLKN
ncbi:hypothetical protein [Methanolacinia paynteri]|uniref:hypothetical protein n=1 Tax=Methanolacinia paynteri TaxID=230356 RepID=UPI0012F6B667|nr:hypothetical protein [Methanolacinia paynteri]